MPTFKEEAQRARAAGLRRFFAAPPAGRVIWSGVLTIRERACVANICDLGPSLSDLSRPGRSLRRVTLRPRSGRSPPVKPANPTLALVILKLVPNGNARSDQTCSGRPTCFRRAPLLPSRTRFHERHSGHDGQCDQCCDDRHGDGAPPPRVRRPGVGRRCREEPFTISRGLQS
jgi:hypothetical protein